MTNEKASNKGGLFEGLFGRVEPADVQEAGLRADLLREWDSSPPIVVVVAIVAIIATTPVIVTAVTAVVSEPVDVADETQLALDLRPV